MAQNIPNTKRSAARTPTYQRQVLSGDAVQPFPGEWEQEEGAFPLTMLQRYFLIIAGVLLLISILLIWTNLVLLSTVPLFLLALVLIAGRFFF